MVPSVILVLLLALLHLKTDADDKFFAHHKPSSSIVDQTVNNDEVDPLSSSLNRKKRNVGSNLRIHFHYLDTFTSKDDQAEIIDKIMTPAREMVEAAVKPKIPFRGVLRIDRKCVGETYQKNYKGEIACNSSCETRQKCIYAEIPSKYLKKCRIVDVFGNIKETETEGEGITNTDIVILIDRVNCIEGQAAYGSSCFSEKVLDRPIFGVINVCNTINWLEGDLTKLLMTVVHETIHVLGFNIANYAYFRDKDGAPLVPRSELGFPNLGRDDSGFYNFNSYIATRVVRNRTYLNGSYERTFLELTLPNVVKQARLHFNCSTLSSVTLEDDSGLESHFDSLHYKTELMSAYMNYHENPLSLLTLALLEDTGWYHVDCTAAHAMEYGRNLGCSFLEGCYSYITKQKENNQPLAPFCDTIYNSTGNVFFCTEDSRSLQHCDFKYLNFSLPKKFRHREGNFYGSTIYSEFCPILKVPKDGNCRNNKANVTFGGIKFSYGINSRCFKFDPTTTNNDERYGAACLEIICETNDSKKYKVILNDEEFECETSKSISVTVGNLSGILKCPSNEDLCQPYLRFPPSLQNCQFDYATILTTPVPNTVPSNLNSKAPVILLFFQVNLFIISLIVIIICVRKIFRNLFRKFVCNLINRI